MRISKKVFTNSHGNYHWRENYKNPCCNWGCSQQINVVKKKATPVLISAKTN